jgi:hypothetical protein
MPVQGTMDGKLRRIPMSSVNLGTSILPIQQHSFFTPRNSTFLRVVRKNCLVV